MFGVDRGQRTTRFASIGSAVTALAPDAEFIDGASLEVIGPGTLLPSTGFALGRYIYNLWPRNVLTNVNQIAECAPDNSNLPIDVRRRARRST